MSQTICDLLDCDDFDTVLENILISLGIGVSVLVNNGDGSFTHTNGVGVITTWNTCTDGLDNGACKLFDIIGEDATTEQVNAVNDDIIYTTDADALLSSVTKFGGVSTVTIAVPMDDSGSVAGGGTQTLQDVMDGLVDKDRAWGMADTQQKNKDSVDVADSIYHTGTVTIGALDSTHNPLSDLDVRNNVAIGAGNHTFVGGQSIAVGDNHTVSGARSIIGGLNNIVGANGLVSGTDNTSSSSQALTFGDSNNNTGNNSILGGFTNVNTASNSGVIGQDNTNNGANNLITGDDITAVTGGDNIYGGNIGSFDASQSIAVGNNLIITGSSSGCALFGKRGTISHDGVFLWGGNNTAVAAFASVEIGEVAYRAQSHRLYTGGAAGGAITTGVLINSVQNFAGIFLETSAGGAFTAAGAGTGAGAHLTTGGVWTNASSRAIKENFEPVSGMVDKLMAIPIQAYNYIVEGAETRRIGATAEDFYNAYGLGCNNKTIATGDGIGVLMRCVQELTERIKILEAQLA